jgi:hypothetical protein
MNDDDIYSWEVDNDVKEWIAHGRTTDYPNQIQEPINKSPHRAYIEGGHRASVQDAHLCWAFSYHQNENPPYINLWSKESALCALGNIHDDKDGIIEIASENCFYDKNKANTKAMVFLRKRIYYGTLKFISKDTFTVERKFRIDTDDLNNPLHLPCTLGEFLERRVTQYKAAKE